MSWLQAMVLAVVQGLTEFLPISSSGHLRIVSELFFGNDAGASFTAVTQLGTEAAVLIYFARDIVRLVATWFRGMTNKHVRSTQDYRLAWYILIGTLPIGFLGFFFQDYIRDSLRNMWITASLLMGFAVLMAAAEYFGRQRRNMDKMTLGDGIAMGFGQALALVPGVSRSGGTITTGLTLGLDRPTAVRYSFYLAIPAVLASGVSELEHVFNPSGPGLQPTGAQMIVATLVAGLIGYACIAWLLRFVERHTVYLFVWYRIALGALVMVLLGFGVMQP